jgi:hypothetical protein
MAIFLATTLALAFAPSAPLCASQLARASVSMPAVQMSVQSELAAERTRLDRVLATIKADLGALESEAKSVEAQIVRKRAVQADVLATLSVAYSRSIVDSRKTALLGATVGAKPPSKATVELLIDALITALPAAARGKTLGDAKSKGWRQVFPKLKPDLWATMTGAQVIIIIV